MTVQAEIPVPESNLGIQAIEELWSGTLSGHVSVAFCYASVSVKIFELILERLAVSRIFLLVGIVGIWSVSYHLATQITACTLGYVSCLYVIIVILGNIQLHELRVLEGAVESKLDTPVVCLYRHSREGELQSLVADGSDVGHQLVAEVRSHRNLHGIQKILGVTNICIYITCETFIEESEVKTHIVGRCCLPLYGRVICLRRKHVHKAGGAHVIHSVRVIGHIVAGKVDIVPYSVLLSGLTYRNPELHCRNHRNTLHERLLSNVPSKGSRWEESPSVRLRELAGSVTTGGEGENITGINRIIHTSVERNQKVLILIPEISRIDRFSRLELYLIRYIIICDVSVCPVVVLP